MEKIWSISDLSRGVENHPISLHDPTDVQRVSDFVYVRCNVPALDTVLTDFETQFEGCQCVDADTCTDTCECISRYGPSYDDTHKLMTSAADPYSVQMKPVFECNRLCKCKLTCENRVVQKGITDGFNIYKTKAKGFGVRAVSDIEQFAFVCEYAGEVLGYELAKKRTNSLNKSSSNYILVLREHLGSDDVLCTYIDPTYIGNVGRFINHSCNPNMFMVPVRVDNNIPKLCFFALRDIAAGEELSYDYSGSIEQTEKSENKSSIENGVEDNGENGVEDNGENGVEDNGENGVEDNGENATRRICRCGEENCRGFLPYDQTLYS